MRIEVRRTTLISALVIGAMAVTAAVVRATDWPMWGHGPSRNMVSDEKGLPDSFDAGKYKPGTEEIDMATTKNVRWVAKLGSQAYGNPTVAGGKVFVGTNNESPRDPAVKGDRGILMCFDEKTGKFLWQLVVAKLGTGKISDWEFLGICSSPAVEGDRVYLVTNRCEAVCLDANNGNVLWNFDLRKELGVFPHNISASSPLIFGDRMVITTANGVDWTHTKIPNPKAPCLVMLDKKTGKLLGEENVGVGARTLHSNWSSPAFGTVNGKGQIIFGAGDGWCYGFDAQETVAQDGINYLKELWRYDCNPPRYRMRDGKPLKYATFDGPSEVIATPVFYKNRVYVPIGQDPEHGEGIGNFSCIDITKTGDITKSGAIWSYDKIHRSLSTPAIVDGLLFVGDFSGFVHCLDAETGSVNWVYDTKSHIWGSTVAADGKVYIGTEDGDVIVLAASKTLNVIKKNDIRSPIYSTPVMANGTLFIATPTHLYAVANK
jgi:outer membrane protein assembly factor BamB